MKTFFPHTSGTPLVSVLIPTRGRPDHLCRAVDSCYSLAKDKSLLEFIFKVDDDDPETMETISKIEKIAPCKTIVSPRGRGYPEMHTWVNQMSEVAEGRWLFLFNDDALIRTEAWDQLILFIGTSKPWHGFTKACLLIAPTIGRPFAQEFIMLRRDTFKLLGHFSLSPHNDNWIYSLMNFCGAILFTEIQIEHLSDTIGDKTREESEEAYKTTIYTLKSIEARKNKLEDARKIIEYFEQTEKNREWFSYPSGEGWYWMLPGLTGREMSHCYVFEEWCVFFSDKEPKTSKVLRSELGERKWAVME